MGSSESKNKNPTAEIPSNSKGAAAKCELKENHEGLCEFDWLNIDFDDARSECGKCVYSSEIKPSSSDGLTWRLQLYPRGYTDQLKDYVALFLQLLPNGYDVVFVSFSVQLFSEKENFSYKRELAIRNKFGCMQSGRPVGWFTFLKRSDILDLSDCKKSFKTMFSCHLSFNYFVRSRYFFEGGDSVDGELSSDFLQLYCSGDSSDVTLRVDGKELEAHKQILAARSPVFRCIFTPPMKTEGYVDISDVSYDSCDILLEFCYTGRTRYLSTVYSTMELYAAAHKFAVYALMEKCVRILRKNYDVINAVDVLVFADKYEEWDLKRRVVEFISQNFKDIGQTATWQNTVNENPLLGTEVVHRVASTYKRN